MSVFIKRNRFLLGTQLYKQIKYIESTGTQYINTEYKLTSNNMRVVCEFTIIDNTSSMSLFGGQEAGIFTIVPYCSGETCTFYVGTTNGTLGTKITANTKHTLEVIAKNGALTIIIDGTTKKGTYAGSLSKNVPITIFANNKNGEAIELSKMQYSKFQLYDNEKLVRDYVSARELSTGKLGLWDKVGKKLYENAGTGTFGVAVGDDGIVLPAGYTRLKSIESTGTQYINTEYVPNGNTEAKLTFQLINPDTRNQALFAVAGQFSFRWFGTQNCFRSNGANIVNFPSDIDATAKHTVIKTATKTTIDNTYTVTTTEGNVNNPLYLFAQNTGTGVSNYSEQYAEEFIISEIGTTILHYIPCKSPSGEVGMYDIINNKFRGNNGTGVFIAGEVVV